MSLCGYVLYIQLKKWYVKFGAKGSLNMILAVELEINPKFPQLQIKTFLQF